MMLDATVCDRPERPIGTWRIQQSGAMQVVSGPAGRERVHFEARAASRLDHEMKAFLAWFNGDADAIDPLLKAGVAHGLSRPTPLGMATRRFKRYVEHQRTSSPRMAKVSDPERHNEKGNYTIA